MSIHSRLLQGVAVAVIGIVAIGTVLVTSVLAEANIPPVAVDDAAGTVQDTPVTIDVLANDSDPDGGTLSVAPGALARAAIVAANPVLFWECYPVGGGTVADRSGNGNDGAISGGVTPGDLDGDCDGDNAFLYPVGSGATVTHGWAAPVGASPRTFVVRFQAGTELAGGTPIFGTGTTDIDSAQFSISRDWDNGQLLFTGFANDHLLPLPGGTNLGDGNEYTIAIVYDGATTVTAYVNGVEGTPTTIGQLDTIGGNVDLGTAPWTTANAGDQLRQFAIFDTALDAGTIASIHSAIDSAAAGQAFSDPANGSLTNNGTDVTYTPDPGFFGVDTFTYSVSDGQGGSASATVTVTVSGVAGAQPDAVTVTTGNVLTFDAVANDVIPDGLTASITDVAPPANGSAVILDATTIEYTPNPGFVGTDTFLYTLTTEPGGETSQALVSVIVTPANDAPTAVDDAATTTMGNPVYIDVIANDSDPDGNDVYVSPGQLARGAILRAGPLLHWECLPESLPTTLHDTSGNGRNGGVGTGVTPGSETGDCDNGTSMSFAGIDGLVTLDNPDLPAGQEARSALVRYKANFATEPADIPLFGYGQNATPYAQFTVSRTVLGNDKLIFTSWANDLHFDLPPGANIADGQEHNIMFVYDGDLTVYAYYDGIPSGQGTLAVPLNTIDDTVMLGASPWGWRSNGDELRQFAIFPNAISEDDAYLVHAAIEAAVQNRSYTDPRFGSLVESPDHLGFTYTPDPGYVGPDQFYYSISDGHGGGSFALVTVDVQPGVSALNDTAFTPIDTPVTINVLANDSAQPGAVLTIDSVTQPPFGAATTDGTTVEFTPQAGWLGIATFTYTVSSDLGGDDTASVSINVGGTGNNFPPIAVDDAATTSENTPVTINVLANDSDPDNDGLSVSQGESAIPGINAYNPSLYWACLPAAGSATLFDQSGNGVDGTINGSVTPGALADDCGGGTTMVFPNAGSYVGRTFPGLPQGASARTVVLRYRTDIATPSTIGMFGFGTNEAGNQQFSVSRNLTGNANLSFTAWGNDTVIELPVSIADGLEHTIAIVYDGGTTITGYVDGVAGTPATIFAPLNTVDSQVILGRTLWGAVGDAAEMRHFAVFEGALSGTDIADIHDIIESVVHDPAFTQGANGTVTQTAFDSLQYTPNEGFSGVDTFTYTVADGNGGESTATVTVTVEEAPLLDLTAADDAATTVGTDPVVIDVLANDIADPTATLVIDSVTTPDNGIATTDGSTVTYTANPAFDGSDSFSYTVSDGLGNTSQAMVTVTVEPSPNQAPIAVDDTATTALNTAITIDVLANDSDPDIDDVVSLAVPTTAIGALNSFSPSLYWTCLPETGTTVPDESGNGNDGTIQGNVVAGPVASDCGGATPVFADGSALIFNSAPGSVPVGSDARTVVVRFRSDLSTPADVGLFGFGTNATGIGQFSVARTATGNDRLWFEAWGMGALLLLPPGSDIGDGGDHTIAVVYDGATTLTAYYDGVAGTPATLFVPLNTVNGQVMLGQTLYGAVSAGASMRHFAIYPAALSAGAISDVHNAIESGGSEAFTQPANGTVTQVGNELLYTPDEGFSGDDTFTYSITDGKGGEASATVTVTVLGNQAPEAVDDAVTTNQGQNITIDVMANDSDPEDDILSLIPSLNAISTLNGYSPSLYWACLPTSGSTVADQSGNGNDGTIQGNVATGPLAGDCGGATPIFVDGTALILNNLPSTLPLGSAARTLIVRYRTDLAVPANVGLFGYGINAAPLGQFSIARTSAGNDRLLFAAWGGDNILHLAPGTNIADGDEHTIAITYDGANTVTAWVDGVAGTPATIPVLDTQNSVAMLGQTLYGAVSAGASMRHFAIYNGVLDSAALGEIHAAIDSGGATAWTQPANGFVSQDGDSLVYDPNVGFVGIDTFTYTIQDEDGHTSTATVTVTVEAVTLAPEDDSAATQQETPVTISVLDNDAGADLSVSGVSNGANGAVTTDGTTVTYTPAPGFFGTDTFTVDVTDGLTTETTTTTVTVNGTPTGPNQTVETESEVPVTIGIIPPVTDPEGDTLTITSAGPASNGTVTIDGNDVTYTSEPEFDGTDTFEVTVEDGNGGSVTVTVTVIVTNNNAPIAVDDVATTNSPLAVTIDVLANDYDPDLDPIQFASAISQMNSYSPSLYWTCLPESGSTVPDESGNGNDGTIQGNVLAGPVAEDCGGATPVFADGSALIFNSTPGSVPVGNDARTVVVRFRSDLSTPSDVGLFGYGTNATGLGQFSVVRTAGGNDRLWFETWGMGALLMLPPGSDIADGNEHTIAIVYDGGTTITAYFDGVAGTPATLYLPLNTVNGQVMLGQTLYGAVSAGASMRHFAIYSGTLTSGNIAAIHAAIEAGGSLSYTQGADGTVTRSGDQLVYTPNPGFIGTDSFTYTITDGKETATATVTVTVEPPLLEAIDDTAFTQQDAPVVIDVLANDEGDDLEVTGTTDGANGTVTTDGVTVTYTPAPGFYGTDTFTVDVTDGVTSDTSTVTVTVNGAPVGPDLDDETLPGTPVTISIVPPVTDPEETALTITSAGPAGDGTVTIDGGDVTYTPAPGFVGTDTFTVTIEDADGGSVTITVTVVVNTPLVVNDDTAFTQQETPVTIDVLDNDEGDAPTIVGTSNGANGTVTNNGTDVTYTPDAGFWGTDTFTVMVQDGDEIASSTVTVTVNGAPAGPDLNDQTPPATPITVAVVPPVADPESGSLSITSAGPAGNGTVEIDGSSVVYTPAPGFVGTDTFPVTIEDEDGGSTTITVTIVVNTELVANDDTAFTQQETSVTVDVLDNDLGDTLVVAGTSNGANGTVTNNGTDVTYTPDAGFWGTDTFTVMVQDGDEIASSTVTVTVNGTPTGPDLNEETLPETAVTISVVPPVTDPEGGPLTITGTSTPSNGSVVIDGDDVVYTPAPGFFGTDSFTVTVADEDGGAVTITVTVVVNTPLVANDDSAFTQQDTPVTVSVLDNDQGDSPTVDGATDGANGTVETDGTTVTYTPNSGFFGVDTFEVTIVDGDETATSTVTVTVNGAPVGPDLSVETPPGISAYIDIIPPVTDPEGGELTITGTSTPANGIMEIDGDLVVYNPNPGFLGTDTFTVTIEDADGGSVTITVTVLVHVALVANDDTGFTQQDTPVTVSVLDNDLGDDLSVIGTGTAANGIVTTDGTTVTYTPDAGFFGTDTFTVTIEDAIGGEPTATSTVTITVNGAPIGPDIDAGTIPFNTPVTVGVIPPVTDPEGTDLTITSAGPATNGTVTINGDTVIYTPNPGFTGPDTFEVTIEDEDGGTVTITVTVNVNTPPAATDVELSTQQDVGVGFDSASSVTDPDGDDVEIIDITTPSNGTVTTDGTSITYTPNPGFAGTDTFQVTVQDEYGDTATFTVTVDVNGNPIADDIAVETSEDVAIDIDVLAGATDPNGDDLEVTDVTTPANGTVSVLNGVATYTPGAGFTGTDSFDVTIEDGNGGSVTITVTVTVSGAPRIVLANNACVALVVQGADSGHLNEFWIEAPGIPSFLGITDESAAGTEVVLGTYPAGTELVLSIHVTNTGHVFQSGAGYNNPDGLAHVQLTPGTGNVLYTVGFEDLYGGGDLDFNDAVVDLIAVDCDVTATDDAATTDEDVAVTIDALDNDATSYGTLAVTDVTDPANGTVTDNAGVFTYTPDAGFSGTDSFTYTVENGLGGTDTATVTVTVNAAPRVILANNACVALVFAASETANNVQLWLDAPGGPTLLGDNTSVGAEYPLNTYTAGTELELSITVTNYGWVFHTGSAASNPDGITHAQVTPGTGNILFVVGFEDTLNGGDLDFNDIVVNVVEIDCGVDAVDDSAETEEDVAVDIAALGNDSAAYGTLAIIDVTDPANGTVTELNGVFTYTPAAGFYGVDTFTYTVENGMGGTDTATVTVTVLAAPRVILAANACVIAEVQQHGEVTYTNQFWLEAPGAPQYLGIDNWDIGEQATLGYFEAGTELVVSIHVTNTGHVFQSGPAYNNPDNFVHVIVTPGTGDVLYTVAFEDLFNGGDQDFNDAIVNLIEVPCDVAAEDDSAFTQQDTAVTVDVLDNDAGIQLEVTSVTQGANGSVTTDGTTATYTPDAGFYGTDTFTYTAENGLGSPDTATVTVTVNGAPQGDDLQDTTGPETPVSIPVIPTVTDPEGTDLTITSAGPASHGTVTIDGDDVVYTPDAGFIGIDSFEVTIEDEDGGTLTITVTVDVNTPLVANDDTAFTQQETPVTVDVLDNDEGDAPAVDAVTDGANGTATTNGTTVTYTPNAGFFGTDTVTVTVVDGSETQTSTLTVTVNGAPTGPDIDAGVTQIDTPITVGIIPPVSDPEGTDLTITGAGPAAHGTVTIDGDDVVYTPNPGYTGPDTFQVTIVDEDGGSVTITVTVFVNAPPTATDVALSTIEGVGVGFATGSVIIEPDGDDVTIVDLGTPANGTVTTDGSSITYLPNPGFWGTDSFLVTIEDSYGAQATFTVTVDVNGAPQGDDIATETEEDVAVAIDVLAGITDPEGDDLSIVDVTAPANGTTSVVGGVVTYTPAAGFFGTDSFDVTIEDEAGNSVTITVTVTVNAAPRVILSADACVAVVAQGGEAGYTNNFWLEAPGVPSFLGITNRSAVGTTVPLGTFAAGTELGLSIHVVDTGHVFQTGPAYNNPDNLVHVAVVPGTGNVLYTVGFEDLLNGGDLDFNDAVIDVIAIDCGVEAVDDSTTTPQGAAVDIAVLGNDSTGHGTLGIVSTTTPAHGVVTQANGVLTYSPDSGFSGTDTFTYTVENGLGGTATATVTVTVQPAQQVILAQTACIAIRVEQHGPVTYTNRIWLESPGAPTYLGIENWNVGSQVTLGTFNAGTELILSIHVQDTGHVYKTGPASRNPDNFMHAYVTPGTGNVLYRVEFEDLYNGGDQDFNDAIFSVLSINCDLAAVDDEAQTNKNDKVRIYVLGNDSSSAGGLRIVSVSNPPHGSAAIKSNGTYIEYDPDKNYQGYDTFTYTVRDATGQEKTATVTVLVGHINHAPVANNDSATTLKGEDIYVSVLDNDTDPDGDDLSLKSVSTIPASQGKVKISGDRVKVEPHDNFTGTITFTYTVKDEDGLTATATVTVTVTQPAGITVGKMTGGGNYQTGSGNTKKMYNWGMELRCSVGGGHFNYHDEDVRLHVNNLVFDTFACSDAPGYTNNKSFDTVTFTGHDNSAQYGNGNVAVTIEAVVTDRGNNGLSDTLTITVRRASNGQVLSQLTNVTLKGGNHEAHNNN